MHERSAVTVDGPQPRGSMLNDRDRRREQMLVGAGIRRLVHAIGPFGILQREALAHAAGANRWPTGGFDRALRAAVEQGRLEALPFGFYREGHANAEQDQRSGQGGGRT
jgi:hypothetical protein